MYARVRGQSHRLDRREKKQLFKSKERIIILSYFFARDKHINRWVEFTIWIECLVSVNFVCPHRYWWLWTRTSGQRFCFLHNEKYYCDLWTRNCWSRSDYFIIAAVASTFIPFVLCDKKRVERILWNWPKHSINSTII